VAAAAAQVERMGPVSGRDFKLQETTAELHELTKCFEKSEQIRKQQKLLIGKMKEQIEQLQQTNAE